LWPLLGYGYWAIEEKATARIIGELGFADFRRDLRPSLDGMPELGWALATFAQRQGYAREAIRAVVAWGDDHFGDCPTVCIIGPENVASLRVAERFGYREFARTTLDGAPLIVFQRPPRGGETPSKRVLLPSPRVMNEPSNQRTTGGTMATTTTPTINTYLSDMIALEQHIVTPLQNQINDEDFQNASAASRVVQSAIDATQRRISALQARLEAVGGHSASPVKETVSSIFGVAATAIDKVRKTAVSKALRDDYTALSLASAGYTMLHTTALGIGDAATAALAQANLTDVATHIMRINKTLPTVVLSELRDLGMTIDPSVSAQAERDSQEAWQDAGSHATPN
jgi:ferritin-like metal-binding protein YciE